MVKAIILVMWDSKDSLIILLYYGYSHMIEFSEFDDLHSSHSVGIQERGVYIYMVIITGNVCNDLFIFVRLGYDVGPRCKLAVTLVL